MHSKTKLMGIVNITPNSFSDGFHVNDIGAITRHVSNLIGNGADVVDLGFEASNPQATEIDGADELFRMMTVLLVLRRQFTDASFSLDTRNPEAADRFLDMGGKMINDYTGLRDPRMVEVVRKHQCQCVVNHFPGQSIQEVHTRKKLQSVDEVLTQLLTRKEYLVQAGLSPEQIILDPGIGFGKSATLNWALLHFKAIVPEEQVMIGYSRKRFLGPQRFEPRVNHRVGKIVLASNPDFIRIHEPHLLQGMRDGPTTEVY